ncbi:hypothetical protein ACI5KX_09395 [Erythrobacter sp. GH1-10]|uniref:hypothetical protein n=1 Tax=Erythrobacter sp. GH1-10 TaxID=3349334 RepID=UPI0038779DFF
MNFYELELRLVAVSGDASAVWSSEGVWKDGTVALARKALFEGVGLTGAEAKKEFPDADLEAVPDLDSHPLASDATRGSDHSVMLDRIERMIEEEDFGQISNSEKG